MQITTSTILGTVLLMACSGDLQDALDPSATGDAPPDSAAGAGTGTGTGAKGGDTVANPGSPQLPADTSTTDPAPPVDSVAPGDPLSPSTDPPSAGTLVGGTGSGGTTGAGDDVASGGTTASGGTPGGDDSGSGGTTASGGTAGGDDSEVPDPDPLQVCPNVGLDAPVVHYVCDCQSGADASCVPGNDSGAGTAADPWKTYGKARDTFNASLGAGETIAFCQGGSFTIDGSRAWVNTRCSAANPCVVRDYQPAASSSELAAPVLNAASGEGFSWADGANAGHEEGYVFLNLDLRSSSGDAAGFFAYNDIDDVLLCGVSIDGFSIGLHVAGSNAADPGSDARNARIVLSHSRITNNPGQGFLGSCDGCGIEYSTFENNGFGAPVLNHNIYFDPHAEVTDMYVIGNHLYRSAVIDGQCQGASLVAHGVINGLLIENNTIQEDLGAAGSGCWGIAIDTGWPGTAESFRNVAIRGNTIVNVGNIGIGLNSCQDCTIENNVVVQEQNIASRLIAAPNRVRSSDDLAMGAVMIRNNTLIAASASSTTGISTGGEGTGHTVVNNVVLSRAAGALTGFAYDLADGAYGVRNHNVCYSSGGGTLNWSSSNAALASWQSSSGADANSLVTNPLLGSVVAPYDFEPGTTSPLISAGHPSLSSAIDMTGASRDAQPDGGAVERR